MKRPFHYQAQTQRGRHGLPIFATSAVHAPPSVIALPSNNRNVSHKGAGSQLTDLCGAFIM